MLESRWLRWIGTGVIAIVAVGSVASTTAGAGQRLWELTGCVDTPGALADASRSTAPIALADIARQPWFRLDARLDRSGALQGQRLAVGLDGDRSSRILDLPAESFAAGPFGRVVLVGSDDGMTSRLEVLDVPGECSWAIAEEAAVIRRATVDPTGETIYEMRVDRATRVDLGIWARPLDGTGSAVQVLEPIAPDERFGRTFSTEFAWDLAGRRLAVQSCGETACRTRVVDPQDGTTQAVADPDLGTLVGLAGDVLVTYAACRGLPCPIIAIDLIAGTRQLLAEASAVAVLASTPDGPRLVHEVLDTAGLSLRSATLDGSSVSDLGPLPKGARLHAPSSTAEAATSIPSDWVLLAPEGRMPGAGPDVTTQLRHVPDGTTVQLNEVAQ